MKVFWLATSLLFTLSGCSLTQVSADEAAKLLGRSIQNVKTLEADLTVDDWATLPQAVEGLVFKVGLDLKNPTDQRFKVEEEITGEYQNEPVKIAAEIIGTNSGSFLRLKQVSLPQGDLPNLAVTGEWYKIANPQVATNAKILGARAWPSLNAEELISLRDHLGNIDFVQPQKVLRSDILYGKQTVHYLGSLDEKKLTQWLTKYEQLTHQVIDEKNTARLLAGSQIEIWQNTKDFKLARIKMLGRNIDATLSFPKWNSQLVITEPQTSILNFDITKILPALQQ